MRGRSHRHVVPVELKTAVRPGAGGVRWLHRHDMTGDRDRAVADRSCRQDPGRWGSGLRALREGPDGLVVARMWRGV